MSDSRSAALLNIFMGMLDKAAEAPPPKQAGLDGRKGFARRMILSFIDDVMRLDGELDGGDWSPDEIARLKEKAVLALKSLNEVE
jgi:hypothetical protein